MLPFANMSRDPDDEYFSDGLAEEIINAAGARARPQGHRAHVGFAFRGKEQDIRRIAEALGVRTILEGSVRRAGSRIRVTAQLINAEDGYHLWSERYDRELTDVFAIQDEIAQAIAGALKLKLVARPREAHAQRSCVRSAAQGATTLRSLLAGGSRTRLEYCQQAIALDPAICRATRAVWRSSISTRPRTPAGRCRRSLP